MDGDQETEAPVETGCRDGRSFPHSERRPSDDAEPAISRSGQQPAIATGTAAGAGKQAATRPETGRDETSDTGTDFPAPPKLVASNTIPTNYDGPNQSPPPEQGAEKKDRSEDKTINGQERSVQHNRGIDVRGDVRRRAMAEDSRADR